jgi:superfamily II DNA or RNA helicase
MLHIAHNATTAKLQKPTREIKLQVQGLLSYKTDGYSGDWDGNSSFFDYDSGMFPAGFVHYIKQALSKKGHNVSLVKAPLPVPLGPKLPKVDEFGYEDRYDYQPDVMNRLVSMGQMIAQVATGGGKSRIARMCYARLGRRTLFLTTRGVLMHQMRECFVTDLKEKVSTFGDGEWPGNEMKTRFNVGMVQTLASRLKSPDPLSSPLEQNKQTRIREATIKLLHSFEFIIMEEAHEASSNSYFEIMTYCKNAHYRLALTATPFMKSDEEANMRLMAVSGPVAVRVSEETLINRGILAKPYFKYGYVAETHPKLRRGTPWQRAYRYGIVEDEHRNADILKEVSRATEYGLSSMILVQHKEHGRILERLFKGVGIKCSFIFGEHEQKERKASLKALANKTIDVLIGSTILDVGVDAPAVGFVGIFGGGKAEYSLRQRIGRGLRKKASGPNVAFIMDYSDQHNNYTRAHAQQRRQIVENTAGFKDGVLKNGADFDYEGLGFKKVRKLMKTTKE